MAASDYIMGRTSGETARLLAQSTLYAEATEHLFLRAGIRPGMRVLDVGCGTGDTSLALARLVGPTGEVVAIDDDPDVLAVAARRAASAGVDTIDFRRRNIGEVDLEDRLDAVAGRLILLHLASPADAVRSLARLVRPGGVVTFQEVVIPESVTQPSTPVFELTVHRITSTMNLAGVDPAMGRRVARVLRDAGLAPAGTAAYQPGVTDRDSLPMAAQYVSGSMTSLLPVAERLGTVAVGEVDPATLADRLHAEFLDSSVAFYMPPLVAAWSQLPEQ